MSSLPSNPFGSGSNMYGNFTDGQGSNNFNPMAGMNEYFGQFGDTLSGISNRSTDDIARQYGFMPDVRNPGSYVKRNFDGGSNAYSSTDVYKDASFFDNLASQTQGGAQFQAAALGDFQNLNQANLENFQRNQDAFDLYRDQVGESADSIRAAGQEAFDTLSDASDQYGDIGSEMYEDRQAYIQDAIEQADNLNSSYMSSVNAGLAAQNRSAFNQLSAEAKTGNPEAAAQLAQLSSDQDIRNAQVTSSLAQQYVQNMANLRMQGASTMNQAAGIRQSYDSIGANLLQIGAGIREANESKAASLEAMGASEYAKMLVGNPYSPVSFLSTLATFFQFSQTSGSQEFSGFSPEFLA